MDLPGLALPPEVKGQRALDLRAADALAAYLRHTASRRWLVYLQQERSAPLRQFDRDFTAADPAIRTDMEGMADRFGARLGQLILTLRRGDRENRAVRPEWDDSYWCHWAGTTTIWTGGGVVSGEAGPRLVTAAARTIARAGMRDCALPHAEWPSHLPLIGVARTALPECPAAIVLDCGHSIIKRGCALYQGGQLARLALLPRSRPI